MDQDRNVTIKVLRKETLDLLSVLLNPVKHLRTEEKLSRDWRGLADLCDIDSTLLPSIQQSNDQTNLVLEKWYEKDKNKSTVATLYEFLERISRHDIIEDITPLVDEDIKKYKENPNGYTPDSHNKLADFEVLTQDDASRMALNQEGPQIYDAFVLFADEDISFATELIRTMEDEYDLKLCVKDRDLVGGAIVSSSIIKLISERCKKLIVVLSDAFLNSPQNTFFYNFAQSLEIDQRQKKIIPCCEGPVKLPTEYSCYVIMDYKRARDNNLYNFWEKLSKTIKIPTTAETINKSLPTIKITPAFATENNLDQISVVRNGGLRSALHNSNNNMLRSEHHSVSFTSSVSLSNLSTLEIEETDSPMISQSVSANNLEVESTASTVSKKKNKNLIKKIFSGFHKHKAPKVAATAN